MTIRIRTSAQASLTVTADWTETPTHVALWANGIAIDSAAVSAAVELPENGDTLTIPSQTFTFDLTVTNANQAGVKEIVDAGVEAGTITWKVSLHDGLPGNAYTANELTAAEAPGYTPGNGGRVEIDVEVTTV